MAGYTGCRIDHAVDFMLVDIISLVRQSPFRRIFKLVARFDLFLVRVAVSAEGLRMTDIAGLLVLRRVELMFFNPIRPVVQVVQCRPDIRMTFAAQRHVPDLDGMFHWSALVGGTGKQNYAGEDQNSQDEFFYV